MSEGTPLPARGDAIGQWLQTTPFRIGEILGERRADGGFVLCHRDDEGRESLSNYAAAQEAAAIARFDDAGRYRSLKTAPNLRHGWRLLLREVCELRLALDLFYPGRLAAYAAWAEGRLATTPLRETLERQSGMYRVAAKIDEAQADNLIGNFCRSDGGCLRTILWKRDSAGRRPSDQLPREKFDLRIDQTGRDQPTLPLLCQEACNLLVAEARTVVKAGQDGVRLSS